MLPLSQQSTFVLASLACHDFEGVAFRPDGKPRLQADLGDKTFLCLRDHGLLTVGRSSLAQAVLAMSGLVRPLGRGVKYRVVLRLVLVAVNR